MLNTQSVVQFCLRLTVTFLKSLLFHSSFGDMYILLLPLKILIHSIPIPSGSFWVEKDVEEKVDGSQT